MNIINCHMSTSSSWRMMPFEMTANDRAMKQDYSLRLLNLPKSMGTELLGESFQ